MAESKPIKTKPHIYAVILAPMQEIAKEHGYNLIVHGSMNRDLDLVAIQWIDDYKTHLELLDALSEYLGVPKSRNQDGTGYYMHSVLPGGRHNYVINLNRGGRYNNHFDEQYYLDISFAPCNSNALAGFN